MAATSDRDLAVQLDALARERGETVRVADVTEFVHSFLSTLSGDLSVGDLRLYQEVEELADYIRQARDDIAALRPDDIPDQFIASATDELDAIVGATESATNQILDAAEQLEELTAELPPEMTDRLTEITTRMYEACNFQDITGQRTTKIVKTLKHIEDRINGLATAFAGKGDGMRLVPAQSAPSEAPAVLTDEDLLNGPQLPENAALQAAIDALFNTF